MHNRELFFEFAQRDLWLLLIFFFWYSVLTGFPGMTAGMFAQRLVRGNYDFSPSKSHVRCLCASLVTFLVMVVIGLAANWWEAKQFHHRVVWCATTLLAGFVVPFLWEIYTIHVPPPLPAPAANVGSRWRVSLRSLILVQLILLVADGFWTGGLRQEVASRIDGRRQQAVWEEREVRFFKLGWRASQVIKSAKYQLRLNGIGLNNASAGLLEVRPEDHIVSLEIYNTNLTDADLRVISSFATLERLTITGSSLNTGLADVRDLRELKYLTLVSPAINSSALIEVASLPNLKELHIECDQLNDADLTELCRNTSVPHLRFDSKGVTDQSLPAIQANTTLQSISIRGSKITRQAASELQVKRTDLNGWFNQRDDRFSN